MIRNEIRVRATRLRPVYEHGCGSDCGKKPGFCPRRRQRNPTTGETKSAGGNRVIGVPDQLVEMLTLHREEQDRERTSGLFSSGANMDGCSLHP